MGGCKLTARVPKRRNWELIMDISRKLAAEFIGTFWLVLGGCGAAVLASGIPAVGISYASVSLAC
jgi:glycerol uptake facilitator-like aquaporin